MLKNISSFLTELNVPQSIKQERCCIQCGKHMMLYPSVIKHRGGKYCSHRCRSQHQSTKVWLTCKRCGVLFRARPRSAGHCSLPCSWQSRKAAIEDRFWLKVDKGSQERCWLWKGGINIHGYGTFGVNGKSKLAHRVSWQLVYGEIPKGMQVLHKCDNPPCVNPSHLWVGLHADNMADMSRKGRSRLQKPGATYRKNHCVAAHL